MVTSIRNGQLARKAYVCLLRTTLCESVLNVLWDEGFIHGYQVEEKFLKIFLKYKNNTPAVSSIKIISKPSLRVYNSAKQLWKLKFTEGVTIVSTNKGVVSLRSCKEKNSSGTTENTSETQTERNYMVHNVFE